MAPTSKRLRLLILLSIATVAASAFIFLRFVAIELGELDPTSMSSDFPTFMFMNASVVVLMVLAFLVVKNVVKLILDRRRRILGAQLRTRLVVAFVLLSLVPTVLLFAVSRGIVWSVMREWFSPQVAASVDGALAVAKYHYDAVERSMRRQTRFLAQQVYSESVSRSQRQRGGRIEGVKDFSFLRPMFEQKLREYGFNEIAVLSARGEVLLRVNTTSTASKELEGRYEQQVVEQSAKGALIVLPQQVENREYLRSYVPILVEEHVLSEEGSSGQASRGADYLLVATVPVSGELRNKMAEVIEAYDDFKRLRSSRRVLSQGYLLTLVGVTMFVLVLAIWVGFYLARMLSVPIQHLAAGTQEIARGNLDVRIPEIGGDELSILVRSFNKMTEDLRTTTGELVARRRYMETVLASVGVGVISLDSAQLITTMNLAAGAILGIPLDLEKIQRPYREVLPKPLSERIASMIEEMRDGKIQPSGSSSTVSLVIEGTTRHLQVSASPLVGDRSQDLGTVLLLDDLTELVSAQRMAAWQEVARRIAHEIKNPLTPIQLSAQRLRRRYEQRNDSDKAVVLESADTIVRQVETIRNLVNEFSGYARMPRSHPVPSDFNDVVKNVVTLFQEGHIDVRFEVSLAPALPLVPLDKEQIGRAVINLLDNAVAAVKDCGRPGVISVTTEQGSDGFVLLTISDNGVGIQDEDKPKLFEPYFSRRTGGTGLGLAIVGSIVADHGGFVRVWDHVPHGATFRIELSTRIMPQEKKDGDESAVSFEG